MTLKKMKTKYGVWTGASLVREYFRFRKVGWDANSCLLAAKRNCGLAV